MPREIILVDNGSVDGTVETVRSRFPDTVIIENADNAGFPRSNPWISNSEKARVMSSRALACSHSELVSGCCASTVSARSTRRAPRAGCPEAFAVFASRRSCSTRASRSSRAAVAPPAVRMSGQDDLSFQLVEHRLQLDGGGDHPILRPAVRTGPKHELRQTASELPQSKAIELVREMLSRNLVS